MIFASQVYIMFVALREEKRVVIEHAADIFIEPSYYKQYLL